VRGGEAGVEGGDPAVLRTGESGEIGVSDLAMTHDACEGDRIVGDIVGPELVTRERLDPGQADKGVLGAESSANQESEQSAFGNRAESEVFRVGGEPLTRRPAVGMLRGRERDEEVDVQQNRH
jgi:hypothetical protein